MAIIVIADVQECKESLRRRKLEAVKKKEKDENNILTGGFVQMRAQHEKPVVVNEKDKKG